MLQVQPAWATPPGRSLTGETRLVLDDGTTLQAHALYLQHASEVLHDALACMPEQPAAAAETSDSARATRSGAKRLRTASTVTIESELPLRGATRKQVLLLLSCLYAFDRGAWVRQLEPPERVDLARIADQFQCIELLQCVDASLVKMSEREEQLEQADINSDEELGWLNGRDAPALLGIAAGRL